MQVTAHSIAQRWVGIGEVDGQMSNPEIMGMLRLDQSWPQDDSVPWCSAFVNKICWILRLPRSKDLRARSWLRIGEIISNVELARVGFDVVIITRGGKNQPGPDIIDAPGHVGFFSGYYPSIKQVGILGGNQDNCVCNKLFDVHRILGIRRLYVE